jgi:hypothetical protein
MFVRIVAVTATACLVVAGCSQSRVEAASTSKELIPAEWTVAEDTSASGEVTTTSLQLPAARQISGLVVDGESRLVLRCIDHRMQAFIDPEQADSEAIPIQLDSAPPCE